VRHDFSYGRTAIDDADLELHLRAEEILAERGTGDVAYSAADYVTAYLAAARDSEHVVSSGRRRHSGHGGGT